MSSSWTAASRLDFDMQSTSESLLARLNSADNNSAWSRFVQLYTPLIYFWGRKVGLQSSDAADLVQDVLTIVFQKLPGWQYNRSKSFRGWLRTVTLNRHREIKRKKQICAVDASNSVIASLPDSQQRCESTWELNYARQLVAAAMELLRPDFAPATWAALKQLIASGRSAAEIASETGVSVWTIYSAKTRLLARLRRELDGLME